MIICLMGPTSAGKTAIAIEVARRMPCDIISVDSAMIYRGMDIGTAKPSPEVLRRVPHRLINIRDPAETYSAAQFRADALDNIRTILQEGRVPLLVGGTMLYFRSLENGLSDLPSANHEIRTRLEMQARDEGWAHLHARLARIDPEAAQRIHPNDPQRIQRALEVHEITGRTLSELHATKNIESPPIRMMKIVVVPENREALHQRIRLRFHDMLARGFVEEVRMLIDRGDLNPHLPSMRAVGYRQMWGYLEGRLAYADAVEQAVIASRQLAKRQMTWLRQEREALWINGDGKNVVDGVLKYLVDVIM